MILLGGRGGSSGMTALKKEDNAQHSDAKRNGLRLGARFYEYTDSNGKVHKGETGNKQGGTYRASYSKEVADYAKKSTPSLQKERNALKDKSNNAYQIFTRSAASKSGSQASTFADADHKIRMIDQVLRRRRNKK